MFKKLFFKRVESVVIYQIQKYWIIVSLITDGRCFINEEDEGHEFN